MHERRKHEIPIVLLSGIATERQQVLDIYFNDLVQKHGRGQLTVEDLNMLIDATEWLAQQLWTTRRAVKAHAEILADLQGAIAGIGKQAEQVSAIAEDIVNLRVPEEFQDIDGLRDEYKRRVREFVQAADD